MKYLNTNHLDLLASYGSNISVSGNFIKTNSSSSTTGNIFAINPPSTSNVYFSVNNNYNGTIAAQYYAISIGIMFTSTSLWLGIHLDAAGLRVYKVTYNVNNQAVYTKFAEGNAPLDSNGNRYLHFRFNLTNETVDIYSNGVLCIEALSYGITSSSMSLIKFGKISISSSASFSTVYFNNFIISDTVFSPTELVTEITPTITTTDWTVADGVATSDTVGDTMTLTAPANSIDETQRGITGYSALFLDCGASTNVNAVDVTQGSTTQQVVLPEGVGIETPNVFSVNQLSDISTTVVARSVSV